MAWLSKVTIGDCTLYLGDAMAIMPTLDPCDLVVSDIPYALTSGGVSRSSKTMSGIFAAHNYANDGQLIMATVPFPAMFDALFAALIDDAECYVMANDKNVHPVTDAALDAGFKQHNLLVWDKGIATPNRWYMKNCEFTIFLWKGKARTINNPGAMQLMRGGVDKLSNHPTEKPVPLMAEYISNSSQRGDAVLDPFMGSGSTGVAAVELGRKFIGIEIDENHFQTACERIEAAYTAPDMYSQARPNHHHTQQDS